MSFELPAYNAPDFSKEAFRSAPDVRTAVVDLEGVAPEGFHAFSIYPEYFRISGRWVLATESRMDCVPVIRDSGRPDVVEFRNLHKGDRVILGRSEDGSEGIFVHGSGFGCGEGEEEIFSFRTGRTRETAYSRDYDNLYELLRFERDHGSIVWVLGPAVVFDYDSREAMSALIERGYVDALLAGNALATHDLEGAMLGTALGQDIYTQEQVRGGHYHHLEVINRARRAGSLEKLVKEWDLSSGVIRSALRKNVPIVLAGSIRDDGPLPGVYGNAYEAQDAMRSHLRRATTVVALATQLHTIASGNMTPAFTVRDDRVRPVFIYSVDVSEFAVNKLRDRGSLEVVPIVANVQDFLVHLKNRLE